VPPTKGKADPIGLAFARILRKSDLLYTIKTLASQYCFDAHQHGNEVRWLAAASF
jgi:hypothetical protein